MMSKEKRKEYNKKYYLKHKDALLFKTIYNRKLRNAKSRYSIIWKYTNRDKYPKLYKARNCLYQLYRKQSPNIKLIIKYEKIILKHYKNKYREILKEQIKKHKNSMIYHNKEMITHKNILSILKERKQNI